MFQTFVHSLTKAEPDFVNVKFKYVHKRRKHWTFCLIEDAETGVLLTTGLARCHPSDVFSKPEGRRISLDRALDSWSAVDRRTRSWIWSQYYHTLRSGPVKFEMKGGNADGKDKAEDRKGR